MVGLVCCQGYSSDFSCFLCSTRRGVASPPGLETVGRAGERQAPRRQHPLIIGYHARTGSRQAELILKNWAEIRRKRRLRKVVPLAVARKAEDFIAAGTNAG
jgi:hypothetical protein